MKVHVPLPRELGIEGEVYMILTAKKAHCGRASSNESCQVSSLEAPGTLEAQLPEIEQPAPGFFLGN